MRATADDAQAQGLERLSTALKPGVAIRIERSRPTWAAGWLEDYPIEGTAEAISDLHEHLARTYGGQVYRLTVLSPGEMPLFVGALTIAGPPREHGRALTRDSWDPPPRAERTPNPQPTPTSGFADQLPALLTAFASFMSSFSAQAEKASQSQLDAVRDMVRSQQKQTSELTNAVLQIRSDESAQRGFAGQVAELMDGLGAMDKLRKRFGAADRSDNPASDDEALTGALKEAGTQFFSAVLGNMAQGKQAMRRPMPARPREVRVRPPRDPDASNSVSVGGGIPDAIE